MDKLEIRYHSAMPNWAKVVGLKIKAVHECEGGGFMIDKWQAEDIVRGSADRTEIRAASYANGYHDGWSAAIKQFADYGANARVHMAKAVEALARADQDLNGLIIPKESPHVG